MSYRCEVCNKAMPRGVPKRRFVQRRPDGQIAREIACCGGCLRALEQGQPMEALRGAARLFDEPPPAPAPVEAGPPPARRVAF